MKVSIQSVEINPKNLSFDQMRQLIDGMLSGNPKEGKRLWDAMACVRGPDLGLNGTNAKIDGSTPDAENKRVARKKQTCTIIRGHLFPGASGCSAADINTSSEAIIHLPAKAEWDHYDKHVHKVAVNLNIPYEIEGEPKKSVSGQMLVVSLPYPEKIPFGLEVGLQFSYLGTHDGNRKIFKTADGFKVFMDIIDAPSVPYSTCKWVVAKPYNGEYLVLAPPDDVAAAAPQVKWPTNCWGFNAKSTDITLKAVNSAGEWSLWKHQAKGGGKPGTDQVIADGEYPVILHISKKPLPGYTSKTLLYPVGFPFPAEGPLFATSDTTTAPPEEEYVPDDDAEGN